MSRSKRTFDVLFAGVGLVLLSPLFVAMALAILLAEGRPVLFRQERVGRDGVSFRILKFRTMSRDAGARGVHLTSQGDARVTRIGRLLRSTKLDELPQLVNVIWGDMSLVGPRPEVPQFVARYTEEQRRVLDLVPGITDPASIAYRHEERLLACAADADDEYTNRIMPEKIRLNMEYASRRSMLGDIVVLLRTFISLGRSV